MPMMGNTTAAGKPWTIEIDCAIPITSAGAASVLRNGLTDKTSGFYFDRPNADSDQLRFGIADENGSAHAAQVSVSDESSSEIYTSI